MFSASEFLLYVWQNAALHAEDEADAIVVGCAEDMVKDGHITKDEAIHIVESFGINLGFEWEKVEEKGAETAEKPKSTKLEQKEVMEFLFGSNKKPVQTTLAPSAIAMPCAVAATAPPTDAMSTLIAGFSGMDVDDE